MGRSQTMNEQNEKKTKRASSLSRSHPLVCLIKVNYHKITYTTPLCHYPTFLLISSAARYVNKKYRENGILKTIPPPN